MAKCTTRSFRAYGIEIPSGKATVVDDFGNPRTIVCHKAARPEEINDQELAKMLSAQGLPSVSITVEGISVPLEFSPFSYKGSSGRDEFTSGLAFVQAHDARTGSQATKEFLEFAVRGLPYNANESLSYATLVAQMYVQGVLFDNPAESSFTTLATTAALDYIDRAGFFAALPASSRQSLYDAFVKTIGETPLVSPDKQTSVLRTATWMIELASTVPYMASGPLFDPALGACIGALSSLATESMFLEQPKTYEMARSVLNNLVVTAPRLLAQEVLAHATRTEDTYQWGAALALRDFIDDADITASQLPLLLEDVASGSNVLWNPLADLSVNLLAALPDGLQSDFSYTKHRSPAAKAAVEIAAQQSDPEGLVRIATLPNKNGWYAQAAAVKAATRRVDSQTTILDILTELEGADWVDPFFVENVLSEAAIFPEANRLVATIQARVLEK